MSRKRIDDDNKKIAFNLSIKRKIIEDLKTKAEKEGEIPSNIIEDLIKKYLLSEKDEK